MVSYIVQWRRWQVGHVSRVGGLACAACSSSCDCVSVAGGSWLLDAAPGAVSYTHLTLPTICSV
eukprot:614613-Prorocentrum_lima.AAC.1